MADGGLAATRLAFQRVFVTTTSRYSLGITSVPSSTNTGRAWSAPAYSAVRPKEKRRCASALAGSALCAAQAYAADDLTITSWGGAYQGALRKIIFEPYATANKIKVTDEEYNGELARLRAQVESKAVGWDIVDLAPQAALQACNEGLIEKIDPAILPKGVNGLTAAQDFVPGAIGPCWVGNVVYSQVMVAAPGLKRAPQSLADFFNLRKFPGRRALMRASPRYNLEMALLADGFHMSSHAVAIGLSAFAYAAARRHAQDPRYAFGTWKIEVLGGFASAIFLLGVAGMMGLEPGEVMLAAAHNNDLAAAPAALISGAG